LGGPPPSPGGAVLPTPLAGQTLISQLRRSVRRSGSKRSARLLPKEQTRRMPLDALLVGQPLLPRQLPLPRHGCSPPHNRRRNLLSRKKDLRHLLLSSQLPLPRHRRSPPHNRRRNLLSRKKDLRHLLLRQEARSACLQVAPTPTLCMCVRVRGDCGGHFGRPRNLLARGLIWAR
jgi:hypothetical protein